ncbi:MAG: phosphatidate cytidylyltransferase [Gemmatimonadota bacterium]
MPGRAPDLGRRTLSAAVFVPVVLGLTWVGGWALLALVAAVVARGSWEFHRLVAAAGHRPDTRLGVALSLGVVAWVAWQGAGALAPLLVLVLVAVLAAGLRHGVAGYGASALLTVGGVLYVGFLGSAPLLIGPLLPEGNVLLDLVFLSIWLTDSAAYLCGSRWGVRRLVPGISPGKTVVGFAAGCLAGLVPALLHGWVPSLGLGQLLGLLAVVSCGGQVGDIVESALKRWAGLKDAPALIPGHGGILDRFDSYLFAFPLAYLYLSAPGLIQM